MAGNGGVSDGKEHFSKQADVAVFSRLQAENDTKTQLEVAFTNKEW